MKPFDAKSSIYDDFGIKNSKKDPKFEVAGQVRISKHKNIFTKNHAPNRYEEIFVIKNVEITVQWTYVVEDVNEDKIVGTFFEFRI